MFRNKDSERPLLPSFNGINSLIYIRKSSSTNSFIYPVETWMYLHYKNSNKKEVCVSGRPLTSLRTLCGVTAVPSLGKSEGFPRLFCLKFTAMQLLRCGEYCISKFTSYSLYSPRTADVTTYFPPKSQYFEWLEIDQRVNHAKVVDTLTQSLKWELVKMHTSEDCREGQKKWQVGTFILICECLWNYHCEFLDELGSSHLRMGWAALSGWHSSRLCKTGFGSTVFHVTALWSVIFSEMLIIYATVRRRV